MSRYRSLTLRRPPELLAWLRQSTCHIIELGSTPTRNLYARAWDISGIGLYCKAIGETPEECYQGIAEQYAAWLASGAEEQIRRDLDPPNAALDAGK